ncbi:MAG: flagellar hook-length control protein FliK [Immundisolibacteraceae bacterium]|nr:flagellar hook-length control protein FliK [Immundisolibacteraceae bacterium]
MLRPTVPTLVAKDAPSTAAGLIERSAVLAGQPLTTGTVKSPPGGGVAAAGEIDDIASSLTGQDRQLLSERGVKFVDTATARTNAVPSAPAEAIQIKPTAVISGDPLPSVPTSFNSSLSVQELPTGNNGQMVDLIAGGARSEGASAGSVVGKSGLAPIDIPVNDPRWGAAVAQRVVMATKQGLQQAQITVTPANLGPIELQIQIQDDKASVTMISPHASVRELLEGATPRLRELFEQQGLTLQDSHVADQDSRGSQFADNESTDTETSLLDSDDLVSDEGGLVVRQSVGLVDRYA